ncbi:MAG: radical SAM protein [bacterium]
MEAVTNLFTHPTAERYTAGIGLTDRCNANCPHCYSRSRNDGIDLDFDLFCSLLDSVPLKSVNFGTGESILYSRFREVIRMLKERQIDIAVTTNGTTVEALTDEELSWFHDIDFSLDFPDAQRHDSWRGLGAFTAVMRGAQRCLDLGVEASFVACLMHSNGSCMGELVELAARMKLNLRVNVYKSVFTREYQPTYEQFWGAVKDMATAGYFIACSEPVVNAALGNRNACKGSPCGSQSFRVHPDGRVVSCVYLKSGNLSVNDLMEDFSISKHNLCREMHLPLPEICWTCEFVDICRGGCTARRTLNDPQQPDEYCFLTKGKTPDIPARWKESKDLVHESYLCTMIFSG